jgi:vancomycin resistance protein YoaR
MTRALGAAALILLVGALGLALSLYRDTVRYEGRILPGVSINGTAVGGRDPAAARLLVAAAAGEILSRTITIHTGGAPVRATLADLGVRADVAQAVGAAFALGRESPPQVLLRSRWRLRRGVDVPLSFAHDEQVTRALVRRLAGGMAAEPRDARVTVIEDEVVLTAPSLDGLAVDVEATVARITRAIAEGAGETQAAVRVTRPRFSTADALRLTTPIARYTTRFVNIPNRNHNIALAAGKLRGVLIHPGEVFSYNQTVGPRTAETGYLPAPVLLNNVLVAGDGGGVCQVSSTLFNVALLADLAIVERHNHTRPVAYLPIGRDATVVYGGQDLRFQNTSAYPLLLWSAVRGRRLTITLYGPAERLREVAIVVGERSEIPPPPHIATREDPELPLGQTVIDPPQPGYRVRTYRVVTVAGAVVTRELIARSVYTPLPRTIRVGTKRTLTPPAAAP